jgi:Alpha-glutamyl/putrescinyl thymine pyrophosphorylase clade 3
MPTFCRHNRFIERCPICSKTLPSEHTGGERPGRVRGSASSAGAKSAAHRQRRGRGEGLRVHREGRAEDDGYSSTLLPGVRASTDASRLAEEIAFSSGRLLALAADPPALYGEVRALAAGDLERATWTCFLIAYLSPLEQEDPFVGIRRALATDPTGGLPDLEGIPLGPRTSHDPTRGAGTLLAYRQWVQRGGGAQALAFAGDAAWSPERRFERMFERLALPGLGRMGRYDLLLTLGRLGLYELRPDSLQLGGAAGVSPADPTTLAAKRVFGIADPLLLERRAAALAKAISVPVEALDLALANWASQQRASLGFPPETRDEDAFARAGEALGL